MDGGGGVMCVCVCLCVCVCVCVCVFLCGWVGGCVLQSSVDLIPVIFSGSLIFG